MVCCPTCGESFEVVLPPEVERPCRLDHDCEVCCRPMVLVVDRDGVNAAGIGE